MRLHEIIFPVLIAVLVARRFHVLLGEDVIVRVVLLPLLLLTLFGDTGLFFSLEVVSETQSCLTKENE